MQPRDQISGIANATVLMLAMLVDELDKREAISKADFTALLREAADDAEHHAPAHLRNRDRFDLFLMRKVADLLVRPRADWKPVVIQGGRKDDDQED